jgi:hydrogenase-4 transcriptional activator
MSPLKDAKRLARSGHYSDAYHALDTATIERGERAQAEVLRIEVLERLGHYDVAKSEAERLLQLADRLNGGQRSACRVVLARAALQDGQFDIARTQYQRAIGIALAAGDNERAFWAQLRLLLIVSDLSGPEATISLLADLRVSAARTGDPLIRAALHLFVGQIEAKRGLILTAHRHVQVALRLLSDEPNVWLEAQAEHIEVAIAITRSDLLKAFEHATRAVTLAQRSGVANSQAGALGNLANVLYLTGQYERALEEQERAMQRFPPRSDNHLATLDILARIHLAQNNLDECDRLLDQIDEIADPGGSSRYVYRHALLLRTDALARRGRYDDALARLDITLALAERSGDGLLLHQALLTKAELLAVTGRTGQALDALERVRLTVSRQPPDVFALNERAMACTLWSANQHAAALSHFERAERIYRSLTHAPGLAHVCWLRSVTTDNGVRDESDDRSPHAAALKDISNTLAFAGRPELIACELVELLWKAGAVTCGRAVYRVSDLADECLVGRGDSCHHASRYRRDLAIGDWRGGKVRLIVCLAPQPHAIATFHAVERLIGTVQELDRARADNEERMTLWPTEDPPVENERFAIAGHMRELMEYARRIARTTVSVLITGESGTGKEILARAIHDFSDRARKPFVPFNCTAIPRDLLESQLFGHRRGAFTGADRDHLGLIRTAREGTLFLDEVGELGLDLQPKLLRFLESGEISPLGEPGSLNIDVRIVAATNANLEESVRAGRFREDLFYRLNVVRLAIRPLRERRDEIPGLVNYFVARAAEEFKKGQVHVAEETMERLLLYRWPGNVRQLQNEIRRMVALAEPNSTLLPRAISEDILGALPNLRLVPAHGSEISIPLHDKLLPTLARIEREMIKAALARHGGKVDAVANALGISRKGLYLKRQRLGL